ncbi:MAG: purine-nucleoside phosphorylase [Acidilobaceae archaeon]|nr:purine-nucleoside phosphorylase [Acidilobaceae archaeon]MCX8166196.1 purine-nucleoside phosphorylase [Acidilobaceae archaeon]MDW7974834.1 purine-nucleoside phosphorylase [Sulfolobales archaeon]
MRRAVHIRASPGDIAEKVVVAGDPGRIRFIAENFLEEPRLVNENRGLLVYTGKYMGMPVTLATHGIGASSALLVFEELIALGAKTIIRLGTCGSLSPSVEIGDLVIPTVASYYPGGPYYQYYGELACGPAAPNYEVLKVLIEEASKSGKRYHIGPVVSSDAFYSEGPDFAERWNKRGAIAVEMECAALFLIGNMRNVKSSALLVTVDSPTHYRRLGPEAITESMKVAGKIVLETLRRIDVTS